MSFKKNIIKCFPRPDRVGMTFWCNDCKSWHYHGIGEGPRARHCPYEEGKPQYWIQMHSISDLKQIKKGIEQYLALSPEERKGIKKGDVFMAGLRQGLEKKMREEQK